ncbi:MAG: glycosyltransferase family 4 protein [Acidobacteriaceae bacterium]|nr:glycosyltransferase family 4 protein [Acidobacteriaceae bacterium]
MSAVSSSVPAQAEDTHNQSRAVPVLLVVRELGLGGIERDVTKLALGFDRSRYLPYVATYKLEGPRYEELRDAGIPILHLDFPSLISGRAVAAAWQFASFIREHEIEIVHAFDPSSVFAVPLARVLRVPIVLSSQLGHRELHDDRTRKQLKLVDRLSDVVVVNCEALRKHLSSGHRVPLSKIELCYNGVDTAEFHPRERSRIDIVQGAPLVVGTVCVLRAEKNLDLLVSAFARLRKLVPGSKLLIVGNGPERERLLQLRRHLNLEDDCILMPAIARVAPVVRSMDIFVSCSRSEAFSNAILEAMACGCALIGSRVGGTPELLGEDERGLLFTSGCEEDLAKSLERLISSPQLRSSLGSRAAEFARLKLGIGRNVERTMEIYDSLRERKRRSR